MQENRKTQENKEVQKKEMKQEFQMARKIIVLITAVIFLVLLCGSFGNGILELIPLACFFAGAAWVVCFLGTGVSRKMIQIGDRISNVFLRVLYYVMLLPLVLIIWLGIWAAIEAKVDANSRPHQEMGEALGNALVALFWGAFFLIFVLAPYIQSLFALLMHKVLKKKSGEEKKQENISE